MLNDRLTGERAWFAEARFGVFVHFGLYTLLGQNENGCSKGRERLEYERSLLPRFDPQSFDADDWVHLIQENGARYVVLTTKHAEGYCLWDTRHTRFTITNTPFRRDLVAEVAAACHRHGLRLGFYYSAEDWHYREEEALTPEARTYPGYVEAQLRELLTGYGQVDEIWFDCGDSRLTPEHVRGYVQMIHTLQPSAVVNDRAIHFGQERTLLHGDFVTPERMIPDAVTEPHAYVECCDAMGIKGWGYYEGQRFWSTPELIRRLSRVASFRGNYLLNIEPQPDGRIRPECVERLRQMGGWLRLHGEAIFRVQACPLTPEDPSLEEVRRPLGVSTRAGGALYLHLHEWPAGDEVLVRHVSGVPRRAQLLGSGATLVVSVSGDGLHVTGLPSLPPNAGVAIVRVDFEGPPVVDQAGLARGRLKVVSLPPGETVRLHPEEATRSGRNGVTWSRINRFANGNVSIGHLIRLDCDIAWHLDAERAGEYDVIAELGTASVQKDAVFTITVAGQTLRGVTVETGWYDVPSRLALGHVTLPAGRSELVLELVEMPRNFSDIHGIVLQPAMKN